MSSRTDTVHRYMEGFRRSDHAAILECLTEDVVWNIPGTRHTKGRAEFDTEIENPAFEGSPELEVHRTVEGEDFVAALGVGVGFLRGGGPFRFAYNDTFTFEGEKISQIDSYVVPLP